DPDNVYVLTGLDEDIADGPDAVDPTQLDLVVELLEDAGEWAHDDTVKVALNGSERLGRLVNYVLKPDPTRLAPSAPFDDEVTAWRALVAQFEDRLKVH
ncbi:primosomal protein, partial [Saccharothrix sp. MB29]|nr:primosomal protein [Saccharothrix sp. MB29]